MTICGMALMMRFQPKWPEAIWRMKYLRYSEVSRRIGMPPSPEHMRTGRPHCFVQVGDGQRQRFPHPPGERADGHVADDDRVDPAASAASGLAMTSLPFSDLEREFVGRQVAAQRRQQVEGVPGASSDGSVIWLMRPTLM